MDMTGFEKVQRSAALSRQEDIIPLNIVNNLSVLLVGAGGIGSNVAHTLVGMGVEDITVMDPQEVALENVFPGHFRWDDVGKPKAEAIADQIFEDYRVGIYPLVEEYILPPRGYYDVVIVSTDTLSSRRYAWEHRPNFSLWVDARMGGTNVEVYAILDNDQEAKQRYNKRVDGREIDLPCGMKATAPLTKGIIPGLVTQAIYDFALRKQPTYCVMYDLKTRQVLLAKG